MTGVREVSVRWRGQNSWTLREARVGSAGRTLTQLGILDPLVGSSLGKIRGLGMWRMGTGGGGGRGRHSRWSGGWPGKRDRDRHIGTDIHIEMDIQEATDT